MHITFYGAVREVTGSMHLISANSDNILLDCGMFQGRREESLRKNRTMPVDPGIVTNLILSHAHIDHSGRIPLLTKSGFNGRIFCTRPTADACGYLLRDSAYIQESDANYLNYKTVRGSLSAEKKSPKAKKISQRGLREIKALLKKGRHELNVSAINELLHRQRLESVEPLYTIADAEKALQYFDSYPYRHAVSVGNGATCKFYDAGHILGSAFSVIKIQENGRSRTIVFTGDIGRFRKPILNDPTTFFDDSDRDVDLLVMESTYGDRNHEPIGDMKGRLKEVLLQTFKRGGSVIIPAFAFGRTQTLLYFLHELYDEDAALNVPIYVDSPLAVNMTRVFGEHPEVYDEETHSTFLEKGENPFLFEHIHFIQSVEESMAVNRDKNPHIVIAASGMCEAGRVLHHLRHKIHEPRNTILIVGYMAEHTLGRRIEEQGLAYENAGRIGEAPLLRFLNKTYPLKARVVKIGGFSAHADKNEMLRWLKTSNLNVRKIALVHGEEAQSVAFAEVLSKEDFSVIVPRKGQSCRFE
ncbi:MAG: MBL fold metallo-hydrolase [Acidobacteria bacterium]|nr:MBL fold metallo-hydrolase [Acidobacteriota bacterium]